MRASRVLSMGAVLAWLLVAATAFAGYRAALDPLHLGGDSHASISGVAERDGAIHLERLAAEETPDDGPSFGDEPDFVSLATSLQPQAVRGCCIESLISSRQRATSAWSLFAQHIALLN